MGRIKTLQASTGTSAGTVTAIDGTATAKSASYGVTDTDLIRTVLVTTGGTNFTFVDGDVSTGGDTITETSHGYSNGQAVYLTTTGVLPTGLSPNTTYFMVGVAANTFQLAATISGSAIDITAAAGGGTHKVVICPRISLPTAADNTNRIVTVKKVDSGIGRVIIDAEGAETIDGINIQTLYSRYDQLTVHCDGTGWHVIAGFVGGYLESKTATATNLTSAQYFDAAAGLVLSAGEWDAQGFIWYLRNSATVTSLDLIAGISTTTGNDGSSLTIGTMMEWGPTDTSSTLWQMATPLVRLVSDGTNLTLNGVTLPSTQTIYLKGYFAVVSSGTVQYRSFFRARKVPR